MNSPWTDADREPWRAGMFAMQAFSIATTFLYLFSVNKPGIRERAPHHPTFTAGTASVGIHLIALVNHAFGSPGLEAALPCWAELWLSYVFILAYMLATCWRDTFLLVRYHVCSLMARGEWCVDPPSSAPTRNKVLAFVYPKISSPRVFSLSLLSVFTVSTVYSLGIIAPTMSMYRFAESSTTLTCLPGAEYTPIWLLWGVWGLIITPQALYMLRGIEDVYLISVDLILTGMLRIAAVVGFIAMRAHSDALERDQRFPLLMLVSLNALSTVALGILLPVLQTWSPAILHSCFPSVVGMSKLEHSEQDFNRVLGSPRLFALLKMYAARDFTIENVLFLEAHKQFLDKSFAGAPRSSSSATHARKLSNILTAVSNAAGTLMRRSSSSLRISNVSAGQTLQPAATGASDTTKPKSDTGSSNLTVRQPDVSSSTLGTAKPDCNGAPLTTGRGTGGDNLTVTIPAGLPVGSLARTPSRSFDNTLLPMPPYLQPHQLQPQQQHPQQSQQPQQSLKQKQNDSLHRASSATTMQLSSDAESDLHQIMTDFVLPSARFELNLTSDVRADALARHAHGEFSPRFFDEIARQVRALVFVNTFGRFVQAVNDGKLGVGKLENMEEARSIGSSTKGSESKFVQITLR